MRYYQWFDLCSDDPKSRDWDIEFPLWCDEPACDKGQFVSKWDPSIVGRYGPPDAPPTDYPIVIFPFWPVYSPRLRELMGREVPGQIQYLPFRLRASVGHGEIDGYCVANYLKLIDCLDRDLSRSANNWQSDGDPIDFAIREQVLSQRLIGDERLFRVLGDYTEIIIREDLAKSIEAAGMTGCKFVPVQVSA